LSCHENRSAAAPASPQLFIRQFGTQQHTTGFDGLTNQRETVMKSTSLALVAAFLASTAYAAEKPSVAFLKTAIEGNFAEIEMGKLAQQNGQNENTKKFGQMLTDDHSAANQKAIDAAKAMGVTPPDGPSAKQKADYDKMSKMKGAQFDRDFATHMVADHEKDIAEYKKESKQADAAGEYAKSQIEVLQRHLQTAKSLKSSKTSSR
jgi:putative membrane protein